MKQSKEAREKAVVATKQRFQKERVVLQPGQMFGSWKVVTSVNNSVQLYNCFCTGCNIIERVIKKANLLRGETKSCGCQTGNNGKKTSLEKYGVEHFTQTSNYKKLVKKTLQEKYGVDSIAEISGIQEKTKQTNLKKYGTEHHTKTQEWKDKLKKLNVEKYGIKEPKIKVEKIAKPKKPTCMEKYGVPYYTQSEEGKAQRKKTNLEKYGVVTNLLTPEGKELTKQARIESYPEEEQYKNPDLAHTSKTEKEVLEWVRQYNPTAAKYQKEGHQLDIYVPGISLGIEFNGLFWHNEMHKENNYHLNKSNHFKRKGIRVIHIWEHEWKYKQGQVKSFLLSALGKNQNRIGARKCNLVWSNDSIEITKAHQLLDSTHIQGHTNSTKYVANVYFNEELVAAATFGRHHRDSKTWVLSRFTTKVDYTIQGILSKISKLACRELRADVVSWADYRLSSGNGYEKAGWKFEELLKPDYFYFKTGYISKTCIISKQSRQKKLVKTPEGMTEKEHALKDGLVRLYDCGKIRYRYCF